MIENWLAHKPHGLTPALISGDGVNSHLPLDRMSLALFNFGTTLDNSRIEASREAKLPWQKIDQQKSMPIPNEAPSTPSISLNDLDINTDDERTYPNHELKEQDLIGLLKTSVSRIPDHEFQEESITEPRASFDVPAQQLAQKKRFHSRLWERKPKDLYLDLKSLSSFSPYNAYDMSHMESHKWGCGENPRLDATITSSRSIFLASRSTATVPINNFEEYPFPRIETMLKISHR